MQWRSGKKKYPQKTRQKPVPLTNIVSKPIGRSRLNWVWMKQEPCDDSDDSEYDNDDHDVTDFQPPNRFVINRAFLTDETFINTSDFHIPPSEFYLDTKFQINNMVGDSENRLDRIKFQNELFKFMYPRLHSELQNMYLNDALDTSDIAAPSKV